MENKVTGTIEAIFNKVQVTDKFAKREFVIKTKDTYPQEIKLQVTQDKTALLDSLKVGQDVEVLFNLRGKSYTNKQGQKDWFTSVEAWKITAQGEYQQTAQPSVTEDDNDFGF